MDFSIILLILILLVLMIPSLIIQRKQRRHLDTIRQLQENLIIGEITHWRLSLHWFWCRLRRGL